MRSRFLFVFAAFLYANNFFSQNLIVNSILGDDVYAMNQIQKLSITNNRKNLKFQFIDNLDERPELSNLNEHLEEVTE